MVRCLNCMQMYDEEFEVCPHCGYVRGTKPKEEYHLEPGMMLAGKYVIGTVIGFGGFGVIYKAWDQNLDKIVAIKEYYPTMFLSRYPGQQQVNVYDKKNLEDFNKGKQEFLNEARNLAQLNSHPNIVHVYDYFEENGTAYFVMEYLEGLNLKRFMQINKKRGKRLSVETALQITQAVLSALKVAHAKGIIHRDIKPGNIFVCKDSTIRLIDFGAARFSDNEKERTRTIIITPGYAPIEQYQSKSKQGPYTDIYAMGAVLYEMLTGVKPDESINRKIEDTLADVSALRPDVPANINSAIMRAMAIQPEIRFQNVDQFAKALQDPKAVRTAAQEIRHRKGKRALSIVALALVVVLGLGFCGLQFWNARRRAILAEATVSVWVPYAADSSEQEMKGIYESMAEEFLLNNEAVGVEVTAIPEAEYADKLREALGAGTGPVLFDSSALGAEEMGHCAGLTELFETEGLDASQYYFLDDYAGYFPTSQQMPLSFDVEVCYRSTDEAFAQDDNNGSYEAFVGGEAGAYKGWIADYDNVQTSMAGRYKLEFPEEMTGKFTDLFSINAAASDAERAAAMRLLYYYLSETAQDYLTVQHSEHLPINREELRIYIENADELGALKDVDGIQMPRP